MFALDRIDRGIICELDQNSRVPIANLARRLRIPPETARYRVERLLGEGIVSHCSAIIDSGRLGFINYKILLKLHSVTDEVVQSIVRYLLGTPQTIQIMQLDGGYDVALIVRIAGIEELDRFLVELLSRCSQHIAKRSLSVHVWEKYLPRTYLSPKRKREQPGSGYTTRDGVCKLDESNRVIVTLLSENSRISATEVAKQLPRQMSPFSISQRIRRLEAGGIITGYGISLHYPLAGLLGYKVLLSLHRLTAQSAGNFERYCSAHPNIMYFVRTLGEWDYEFNLEAQSPSTCRDIIMDMTREFPHFIRDYSPLLITKIDRYGFYRLHSPRLPSSTAKEAIVQSGT